VFSVFGFRIDASWFDLCSMCCGAFWMVKLGLRRRAIARKLLLDPRPWLGLQGGMDYATGTSLFPFLILLLSPLSSDLLNGLLQGGKAVLSVAGLIALANTMRSE
jgi:hypothetical protein